MHDENNTNDEITVGAHFNNLFFIYNYYIKMKKLKSIFKPIWYLQTILVSPCCVLASCSSNNITIIEPQSKTLESQVLVDKNQITTNAIIGAIFIKNLSDPAELTIEAKEVGDFQLLGDIKVELVHYSSIIYYLKLTFSNNFCYANEYKVSISYYYKKNPVIIDSIYSIIIKPELVRLNTETPIISPTWNFDTNSVNYSLVISQFVLCHPENKIFEKDFSIEINTFDSDLETAKYEYISILPKNKLELTFSFGSQNLFFSSPYHLNISIKYKNLIQKKFDLTFLCERGGWDLETFITPSSRNVLIKKSSSEQETIGTIDNFILCGFSNEINNAKIYSMETKKEIENVSVSFSKMSINSQTPFYSMTIHVNKNAQALNNCQFYIAFASYQSIKFDSGYFLTISE